MNVRRILMRTRLNAFLLAALTMTSVAAGHWAMPTDAPVDRLVSNLEQRVNEAPKSARAHYELGRVHSLAFNLRTTSLGVYERRKDPATGMDAIAGRDFQRMFDPAMYRRLVYEFKDSSTGYDKRLQKQQYDQNKSLQHMEQSIEHLRRAIELDSTPAKFHLSLGYTLDRGRHLAAYVDTPAGLELQVDDLDLELAAKLEYEVLLLGELQSTDKRDEALDDLRENLESAVPILLRYRADPDRNRQKFVAQLLEEFWTLQAIDAYFAAFKRGYPHDSRIEREPLRGLQSLISYEAGQSMLRLVVERDEWTKLHAPQIKTVKDGLSVLDAKPENLAMTPIIISLEEPSGIDDLICPAQSVTFDLDGNGTVERWQWVKPTTALLVWDPTKSAQITSGRQLFGQATWWMFFEDGYSALDALDNDRDGWLQGEELNGLALWFDRNSDGQSERAEVIAIEDTDIETLATTATGSDGIHLKNELGVQLRNGKTLPSYDWIAQTVPDKSPLD